MSGYNVYWGETHDNNIGRAPETGPPEDTLAAAASHLDFYAAGYYTCHSDAFEGAGGHVFQSEKAARIILEDWKTQDRLDDEWARVKAAVEEANEPGRFVTFPGYEWHGDGSGGDHNVSSPDGDLPIFHVDTLPDLYDAIRKWGKPTVAIPHHVAYQPGIRGRDWSVFDEELSPYAEIYSIHGCSETDEEWVGLRRNPHMGPGHGGGTYQDALDRGLHIGAICSNDNWGPLPGRYNWGIMACLAKELTRESIWEAMRARRVYGVTGDRIELDFKVGDAMMGEVTTASGAREIAVSVKGLDAIDRIEILRGDRVIATHCHQGTWDAPPAGSPARFMLRIECGWGPRPNELDMPERHWEGELSVAGGKVAGTSPCWLTVGSKAPEISDGSAKFHLVSHPHSVGEKSQTAQVFEIEADPAAEVTLQLNGIEMKATVAELMQSSRLMVYLDECRKMLAEHAGLDPKDAAREDVYNWLAYKCKIHRAIPEAGFTASMEFTDDEPIADGEEIHYRVRVEQRNGQRAWSSPIWVSRT